MCYWVGNLKRPDWWTEKQKFRLVPYVADDGSPDFSIEIQIRELWTHKLYWETVKCAGEKLGWPKEKIDDLERFVVTHAMYEIMAQISGHNIETK